MKPILFLHAAKTGGTSIREALVSHGKAVSPHPRDNGLTWHAPFEDVKQVFTVSNYFIVTSIRCPFRRAISYYEADRQIYKTEQGAEKLTFNEFFSEEHRSPLVDQYFLPCWDYARHAHFTIHFDSLRSDFKNLCSWFGYEIELPVTNVTQYPYHTEEMQSRFNDETREYIERRFADDIKHLGYSFDKIGK